MFHMCVCVCEYLPVRRSGLGPNRSMRMPSGSVAALSRKEPMVKPRLSISSCSTQLIKSWWLFVLTLATSVSFSIRETENQGRQKRTDQSMVYSWLRSALAFVSWLNDLEWLCLSVFPSFLGQLTCAKVRVKALVFQHDEQRSPTKQHSRKSQIFHHCRAGHPPSPPERLRQWRSQPSVRKQRKLRVRFTLSATKWCLNCNIFLYTD